MRNNNIHGSGHILEEQRQIGERFDQIISNGAVDVEVIAGNPDRLRVRADDNILPILKTRVEGRVLHVEIEGSYQTQHRPVVLLELNHPLEAVTLNGSGDMNISWQGGESFSARLVGSGNLSVAGTVDNLSLNSLGSGNFQGKDLIAGEATLRCMGSGDSTVHAERLLEVNLMGSGDCYYAGHPKVHQQILGTGRVAFAV